MVIAMNNDFSEMFEKMEKRKQRKFRFYVANLIYQWLNIALMVLCLAAPFLFKLKIGPFTYFSNFIFIPLFSTILYYATRDAIKTKIAPVRSEGGLIHCWFEDTKVMLPSIFAFAQWMAFTVCQKETLGNYSWLVWALVTPWLFFAISHSHYLNQDSDDYYEVLDDCEIDNTKSQQALNKILQIMEYEPPKSEQQIKRIKKLKKYSFKVYVHNLFYQWFCLVGMVLYMIAPIIWELEVSETLRHFNLVLIPVLTVVLCNQTKFAIENKAAPNLKSESKIKGVWKILSLILPSFVAACEWGSPIVFINNSLGVGAAIIIVALLHMFSNIILLCCISDQEFEKENENE